MQNMASVDRLSRLSDGILSHILSFLPTKLSVSTSILAKRWRFLWAHASSLRFEGDITSLDVINRVMALHKPRNNMNTFSLSDMPHFNEYQLETLIITAINHRNVQRLHLRRVKVVLPRCIFKSKTLVDLRLDDCPGILSVSAGGPPTCLPSLKRLYLHGLTYPVEEALPHLLSGCPVLEELSILKATMDPDLGCLNISSSSLKKLVIRLRTFDYKTLFEVRVLKINAPTLWYLKLHTCYKSLLQLSLSPMPSLIEADMRLYFCDLSIGKLFHWFPNVKCLKLSGLGCMFLGADITAGPVVMFDCLTKLELGFSVDWNELFEFLEITNKLQVLVTHQVNHNCTKLMGLSEDRLIPSLKTITIRGFGCSENELNMVKYILRNSRVLKRMEIYSGSSSVVDLEAKFDAVKRILLFDRASPWCKVSFD